jgi:hypothetical protein
MERKPDIEDQINAAINSAKSIQSADLPFGFSDKVVHKLHLQHGNNVRSIFTFSPLLRVAAMFILVTINIFALRFALSPQPAQNAVQYGTIKDFVNDYQINDANDALLTSNLPEHEQP